MASPLEVRHLEPKSGPEGKGSRAFEGLRANLAAAARSEFRDVWGFRLRQVDPDSLKLWGTETLNINCERLACSEAEQAPLQSRMALLKFVSGESKAPRATVSEEEFQKLADRLTTITTRLQQVEARLDAQSLASELESVQTAAVDLAAVWMTEHPEELKKFRGRTIAVHPTRGVVAAGADYLEVHEALEAGGYGQEVLVTMVPES